MNVVALLDETATKRPAATAIIDSRAGRERCVSFAGLLDRSRRIAALFLTEGLRPGDRVVILVPMSADLYAVLAAALRIGIVPVFIDPAWERKQLERAMATIPSQGFVGSPLGCLFRLSSPGLRRIRKVFVRGPLFPGAVPLGRAANLDPHAQVHPCGPGEPAMLSFTSGSTGPPKGLLRSHELLLATHRILSRHLRREPDTVDLATLPVFVLSNLAAGATTLIPDVDLRSPGKINARKLVGQILRWKPVSTVASPALLERLADYCLASGQRLNGFKDIAAGGAPVFPRLLDKLGQVAPGARVRVLYGSTEAEPIALAGHEEISPQDRDRMHSGDGLLAGTPIPEIEVRVIRDEWGKPRSRCTREEFQQQILPVGSAGEIVVSGPHVSGGYLGGRGDSETKFRVGGQRWHRTGDAGWLDSRGRLWLVGRCADAIREEAGVFYPFTVEAALSASPGVVRSALVRHHDRNLLVLELNDRFSRPDLAAMLQSVAGPRIDQVVVVKKIPVDSRHNAKVLRSALRRLLDNAAAVTLLPVPADKG